MSRKKPVHCNGNAGCCLFKKTSATSRGAGAMAPHKISPNGAKIGLGSHKFSLMIKINYFVRFHCYHVCFSVRCWSEAPDNCMWMGNYFASQPPIVCQLLQETIKIIRLLLVVPATASGAERSVRCEDSKRGSERRWHRKDWQIWLFCIVIATVLKAVTFKLLLRNNIFACETSERRSTSAF